jgi:hypothetical protein
MNKNTKSYLIIDKMDFTQKLQNQITLGKELFSRQIPSDKALENFKDEISDWSGYNLELLKQSFDNPDNEYRQEYESSFTYFGTIGNLPLAHKVEYAKKEITRYIAGLEKLINKIDLIPVKGIV